MFKVESIKSVEDRVDKGYSIICYGAGKMCSKLEDILESPKIIQSIKYIIDENKDRQEEKILLGNNSVEIISLDKAKKIIGNGRYLIIINNLKYEEILEILDRIPSLREVDIYSLELLGAIKQEEIDYNKYVPTNIRRTSEALIPKIIHYCWFGNGSKSDLNKMCIDSWKKCCPDYEIIEWNESNYDVSKNNYMYQAYKREKWGFVPDYARLDIVYNNGGIYLDTDVEIIDSLDDLLYQEAYCAFEHNDHIALGLGFGARKGNSFIKEWLDDYEDKLFIKEDGNLNLTASPVYQTEVLKKHGLVLNGEYQFIDGLTIYPGIMINGMCSKTRRVKTRNFTKSIHHYEASWEDSIFREHNKRISGDMNRSM
ncbi:Glycosyltransferase sugar-binding region containing DXD motif-containing protein [Pseudobutyrivibrio sp. NOR37]|nr:MULTISPECIES: glycosyltransferase [Pseudobutyrivibrio]SFR72388.1 Glycosyltransferase sugar-binding region containing DXD motif-containing protein [Pseudobutyrivibrio sp. NOR37]